LEKTDFLTYNHQEMKLNIHVLLGLLLLGHLWSVNLTKLELNQLLEPLTDDKKLEVLQTLHLWKEKLTITEYRDFAFMELELARKLADEVKIAQALYNLAHWQYECRLYDEALELNFQARELFLKAGRIRDVACVNQEIGHMFFYAYSDFKRALPYYEISATGFLQAGDQVEYYRTLNNMAEVYYQTGDLEKAVSLYIKALDICERFPHQFEAAGRAASIRGNLAEVYFVLGDEDKAYALLKTSLEGNRNQNRQAHVAEALSRFGDFARKKEEYKKALDFYHQALEKREYSGFQDKIARELYKIGDTLSRFGQYNDALQYLERSFLKYKGLKDSIWQARTLFVMGQNYQRMSQFDEARKAYDKSIAISVELGFKRDLLTFYPQLAEFYLTLGNTQEELRYRRLYSELQDELLAPAISARMASLLARYEQNREMKTIHRSYRKIVLMMLLILLLGLLLLLRMRLKQRMFLKKNQRLLQMKDELLSARKKQLSALQSELKSLQEPSEKGYYKSPPPREEKSSELMLAIIKLMEEERVYSENTVTLSSLSERLKTNTTTLSRVLNENVGMKFTDLLNHYRVEEAKRILRSDDAGKWDIVDICFEVGFNSLASFYRVFKKHTGFSPTQFQQGKIFKD